MKNKMIGPVQISTIAKNMIFPSSMTTSVESISEQGKIDYSLYPYRMQSDAYSGDSDPDKLLDFIELSLQSKSQKKVLLLLSDGKDSMALALGLSRLGIKATTLTFLRSDDQELRKYVEEVSLGLGHDPYFITSEQIGASLDLSYFMQSCQEMPGLVMDQGFIYFLFGMKLFFDINSYNPNDYRVLDGLGNDETFGYLPSKNQLMSFKLSKFNLWKIRPKSINFLKWYIRSPSESHGDLSALAGFFPFSKALDLNQYFSKIEVSNSDEGYIDFRAFSRGSFHDHQCMMGKTITACAQLGADLEFPWLHPELASYVFNLPQKDKYKFECIENKIALRKLLTNEVSWSQSKRGVDLYFDLDYEKFLTDFASSIIPEKVSRVIIDNKFLSSNVKKRASLELLNLYGYCLANGLSDDEISKILE
ncbi:asparagine synthase-related protein [Vibrio fortis]|uniref:asparagine synthase-related protein n=1 Tax=Vibrio fortis TaxID=212667 RepID=UPI0036F3120F